MRVKSMGWTRGMLGMACALGMWAAPSQAAPPQTLKVGQTGHFTLEKNRSKDYAVSLSKGSYQLVWDAKRVDEKSSNIIGKVALLKPNGVIIDSNILNYNEIAVAYRVGSILKVVKPYVARFRVSVDQDTESWFTVVPTQPAKRVPFGWGETITPARISSDNGVGGEIEPLESIYHSITLPKGKWSISLGLELPEDENTNLLGSIDLLDTLGFAKKGNFVSVNDIGQQGRKEGILNVLKPTSYLLRVTNDNSDKSYKYDVTIEPAS